MGELEKPKTTKQSYCGTNRNMVDLLLASQKIGRVIYRSPLWFIMGTRRRNCLVGREYIIKIRRNTMTANLKNYADVWKGIPWKSLEKSLNILQYRIYKATKNNDVVRVKKLQRLLLYSKASKFLAVKQITQLNIDKRIYGTEQICSLSLKQRLNLATSIRIDSSEEYSNRRKSFFSNINGKRQRLHILTIKDRIRQCILNYALTPVYEAQVSYGSYVDRFSRNSHNVETIIINNIQTNLNRVPENILKMNVKKCFEKIDYGKLIPFITLPSFAIKVLKKDLLSGTIYEKATTFKGLKPDVVVSPVLATIALHGLEEIYNEPDECNIGKRCIRYLDDIVFFLKPGETSEILVQKIQLFLDKRGLNTRQFKFETVKIMESFDFFRWTFKVNPKCGNYFCYPTTKNIKSLIGNIKYIMRNSTYSLEVRVNQVKFVYGEWFNYNKDCNFSKLNLWPIKHWLYEYIRKNSSFSRKKRIEIIQDIFAFYQYKNIGYR